MKSYKIFILPFVIGVIASSCGSHESLPVPDDKAILDSITKTAQTAPATVTDIANVIKLNGKIQPDETKEAKVFALVSGKLKTTAVEMGDHVTKGQTLGVLQSTEVAGITNDLSLAQANVEMAKKNMEAKKDLYEGNLATEQEYISSKIDYNKALSELERAKQVSSITGGKSSAYILTAPINGYVIEKNVTNNSEVRQDNNASLFTIADLSNVWIIANVYETDITNIHLGDTVTVNTLANPEKDYIGKIDKIYNVLDPATRTMRVRISMNNPGNELKPEMFATIKVKGKSEGRMLSIPSQAIVMDNSKHYVVLRKDNQLKIQEIELVKRIDKTAFIHGLSEGDQVVTDAQVFLYEALNDK